jgi:ribose transport system substrate-binding protein
MKSTEVRSLLLMAGVLLCAFRGVAFGQDAPTNAAGRILSIAAVDFPQIQPYHVRTESERKACDDYRIRYTLLQPSRIALDSYLETLDGALRQGFDAIILEPWDVAAFRPLLDAARMRRIPLVAVHQRYPDPSYFISTLYVDNAGYGRAAADAVAKATGGTANVVILMPQAGVANLATIRDGFIERAGSAHPGIRILDTLFTDLDPATAGSALEAAIRARPQIDTALWLEGATVTAGVDVAQRLGIQGRLRLIGMDDPPAVIASISKGEVWGTLVPNFWKEGYEAVRNTVDYFTRQPFPKETDCGAVLVDRTNWKNYLPLMWAPVAIKGKPYPR